MPSEDLSENSTERSYDAHQPPWETIEAASADSLPDAALAQSWIALARSVPALARLLLRISSSKQSTGLASQSLRAFSRRPDWLALADALRDTTSHAIRGDEVAIAHVSRAVAELSTWTTAEDAFWHALAEPLPVPHCRHSLDLQPYEPAEQCRIVGQWLLDAVATKESPTASTFSRREAAFALDSIGDEFDFTPVLAEIEPNCSLACHDLAPSVARRLACLARLAAYRRQVAWHDALHRLIGCELLDRAMELVASLLNDWIDDRWGVWIASTAGGQGVARWIEPGPQRQMLGFCGSRDELESSLLPARFRSSQDLACDSGSYAGRVYSDQPIDRRIAERWLPRLAAALSVFVSRYAKRRDAADQSTHAKNSAGDAATRDRQRLRQAIGEFSAGAGHEINNPLGAIAGHAARLIRDEVDPERRRALQQISSQTDRIRRMIRDLQVIGGEYSIDADLVDLSEILEDAAREAEKRISGGRRSFESCEPGWRVRGNRSLLARMVAELVVNGAQAAGPDGQVSVHAERSHDQPSAYEIVVTDTGPGFSAPERHHAFVPFFSGRQAGRGLGMGLPVAQRIASDHGGEIAIDYVRPTTLRILLPAA